MTMKLLCSRSPILNDRNGVSDSVFHCTDQEPAVACDIVVRSTRVGESDPPGRVKQRQWPAGLQTHSVDGDGHCHERSIGRHIVKFLSIGRPAGLQPTRRRGLPLPGRRLNRPDINLKLTGLVRYVRHPAAVWGELSAALVEACLQKWKSLSLAV